MAERRTPYMYGSEARALEAAPIRRREEEIRRRQRPSQDPRRKVQPKTRIDKVSVLLTCITFVTVMFAGIFYLHLQFQSTYLSKNVVNLQSEVVEMEKKNAAAEMKLENSLNLTEIYDKATKELGMAQPREDQIYTYVSKKSTQVRQHGSIPQEN